MMHADNTQETKIRRRARRNQLQQARRATPEAKAREARASRISYWRSAFFAADSGSANEARALRRLREERGE